MSFEFVPWTEFASRMLNEMNSGGKLCDLMIWDSQWVGGAAVTGYPEWPKGTPNYWSLPAFGDVVGWTDRRDWFARPESQAAFKEKYGRDLAVPATYADLMDIAQFFQGPDGDKFAQLGGQGISVVAASDKQEAALTYIKWFAQPEVQAKGWKLGCFPALRAVVEDPGFVASAPYAQTFLDSMAIVKDFWAEPAYATLLQASQERFHDYVVAGNGTAKEALDGLAADWTETFEEERKY